jgi:hypothetical protein
LVWPTAMMNTSSVKGLLGEGATDVAVIAAKG